MNQLEQVRQTLRGVPAEDIVAMIEQNSSNMRSLVYPKDLRVPPGFRSPRELEIGAYSGALSVLQGTLPKEDATTLSTHVTVSLLIKYQVPTYFVSEEFCEALLMTEAPEDLQFSEIAQPMPAMLFMLPEKFSLAYFGHVAPYLTITFVPVGYRAQSPLRIHGCEVPGITMDYELGPLFVASMLCWEDGAPMQYDSRTPVRNHTVKELVGADFEQYRMSDPQEAAESFDHDKRTVAKLTNLAVNILLGMTAEPELITRERILIPAKKRDGKVVRRALWKPNFIGERFRISYETQAPEGSHRSPHAHWRRGHWRNQRHGPARTLVKRIWIKPVFVGLAIPEK